MNSRPVFHIKIKDQILQVYRYKIYGEYVIVSGDLVCFVDVGRFADQRRAIQNRIYKELNRTENLGKDLTVLHGRIL